MDDANKRLEAGGLAYRPPRTMREGETRELIVRVGRNSAGDLGAPPGEDPLVTKDLLVGTPMTAQLIGDDFIIDPPESSLRVLSSSTAAEWSWRITPTRTGKKTLTLVLAVVLDETNLTPIVPPGRYVESIEVRVDPWHTPVRLATTVTGALAATGLSAAAVAAALWAWVRRRRAAAEAGRNSPSGARAGRKRVRIWTWVRRRAGAGAGRNSPKGAGRKRVRKKGRTRKRNPGRH